MDVCGEPAGTNARAFKGEELPSSQLHNNRGRMNSSFWKKAVVCDLAEETVKFLNEKDIGRSDTSIVHVPR